MASTRLGYQAVRREDTKAVAKQPTKFLRFKEGDIMFGLEIIKNNPIQNNRWNAINAVPGKVETNGSYKIDVDPNDIVHWMSASFGAMSSTDISSLLDTSVYEHTLDHFCKINSMTVEQAKGEFCGNPLIEDGQNYQVDRAFGVMIDTIKMSGSDSILECEVEVKAHGLFQRAKLIANEDPEMSSTVITAATWLAGVATITSTAHGLSTNDIVTVAGVTPSGYNGTYKILDATTNTFDVAIAVNPGAYVSGGTVTKLSMRFFDTVEGVVATDLGKFYEKATGTFENATVQFVDIGNNVLAFNSITSLLFTVANESKFELIPQTPSYTDPKIFSFTHVRFRFGDDIASAYLADPENVEDWEFEYKNNLEERYGSLRSSASQIGEKGAEAMIKFSKFFENVEDRDRYRDQIRRACVMTMTNNEVVSATDTNLNKYTITLEMSDVRFTTYELPTGTDELYAISAELSVFYDNTDGRALRVKVKNKNSGTFYTG